tara:strand:+ start:724 stop:1506 length:783 start_codon:yes stop_codon:yes gene_type:complete
MKAKKSLGQNFLTSQSVVDKIITTAFFDSKDIILEIGTGKGILTKNLLEKSRKVISVEKDDKLIPFLKEKFRDEIKNGKLILVHGDILTFNFRLYELSDFKIVANIPYYITGEFLRKMLSSDIQPNSMVLLLQKEVAERIARSKKESILSISVKVYGEPKYIQTVKKGSFSPAPKVDSAILSIENISKKFFDEVNEEHFFKIMKLGFAHKRKLLISNLSALAGKEKLKKAFIEIGINEKARAEDLSISQWKKLLRKLNEN